MREVPMREVVPCCRVPTMRRAEPACWVELDALPACVAVVRRVVPVRSWLAEARLLPVALLVPCTPWPVCEAVVRRTVLPVPDCVAAVVRRLVLPCPEAVVAERRVLPWVPVAAAAVRRLPDEPPNEAELRA